MLAPSKFFHRVSFQIRGDNEHRTTWKRGTHIPRMSLASCVRTYHTWTAWRTRHPWSSNSTEVCSGAQGTVEESVCGCIQHSRPRILHAAFRKMWECRECLSLLHHAFKVHGGLPGPDCSIQGSWTEGSPLCLWPSNRKTRAGLRWRDSSGIMLQIISNDVPCLLVTKGSHQETQHEGHGAQFSLMELSVRHQVRTISEGSGSGYLLIWLTFFTNRMGFRITIETHLWVCL